MNPSLLHTALIGYGLAGRVIHRPLLQAVEDLHVAPGRRSTVLRVLEVPARSSQTGEVVRLA